MASPKKSEKFCSVTVNSLVVSGAPVGAEMVRTPPGKVTTLSEFHHLGSKAVWTSVTYDRVRPRAPGVLRLLASGPSTLSVGSTHCLASGVRLSIFLPNLLSVRPVQASAKLLAGTAAASEARLAGKIATETGTTLPSACTWSTRAFGFLGPVASTPLKMALARPSQKLRKVKIALIIVGVFRGCTRRTFTPPTLKIGSGVTVQFSSAGAGMKSLNFLSVTLCEETTSSASKSTAERRSSTFASLCRGKLAAVRVAFGFATSKVVAACSVPGLTWFFSRLSAPPWKWQLPQVWMPSLPSCMSQKSALPSATAAASSRTKPARLGFGTGTVPRAPGRPPQRRSPVETGSLQPADVSPGREDPGGIEGCFHPRHFFAREEVDALCAQLDPSTRMYREWRPIRCSMSDCAPASD